MSKTKYRNEWKYVFDARHLVYLEGRLQAILERDAHSCEEGNYIVRSLYFDDYRDSCVHDNDSGTNVRHKYRIRYYNDNADELRLEKKIKVNGMCRKVSCRLTREECELLINGRANEVFWKTENEFLKKFCVEMMTKHYLPKVIVHYERTAYVQDDFNVRITIDRNISASNEVSRFLDCDYTLYPLQEMNEHLLEVKFDEFLPGYIRKIVYDKMMNRTSFSKYYLGRKKLQMMGSY